MADTAHIFARYHREADTRSAEAGQNSAAAHRQHTATGVPATGAVVTGAAVIGVAVTGVAIGRVAVTGAAAADSSLSAEVIRTYSNWYPYWGWGYPYLYSYYSYYPYTYYPSYWYAYDSCSVSRQRFFGP